jgi:hypothetical protein
VRREMRRLRGARPRRARDLRPYSRRTVGHSVMAWRATRLFAVCTQSQTSDRSTFSCAPLRGDADTPKVRSALHFWGPDAAVFFDAAVASQASRGSRVSSSANFLSSVYSRKGKWAPRR